MIKNIITFILYLVWSCVVWCVSCSRVGVMHARVMKPVLLNSFCSCQIISCLGLVALHLLSSKGDLELEKLYPERLLLFKL